MKSEVEERFSFHPAEDRVTQDLHDAVRSEHRLLARKIDSTIPDCREKSLALTALQESMMWCNAAVAYRMKGDSDGSE